MLRKPVKFNKILPHNLESLSISSYFIVGHTSYINSLDIDNDCIKMITSSSDLTIKLWNLQTGYILDDFSTSSDHKSAMFVGPNYAVSSPHDEYFVLWNLNQKGIESETQTNSTILKISVISSKSIVLTGCSDYKIYFWACPSCDLLETINISDSGRHSKISLDWLRFMKPSYEGDLLVFAFNRRVSEGKSSIVIYNSMKKSLRDLTCSHFKINHLIIDRHSQRVFYTSDEKVVRWCYLSEFTHCKSEKLSADPKSFSIDPEETRLFVGLSDGNIAILQSETLEILQSYEIHIGWVLGLKLDWVRNELVSCSDDKTLKIFSLSQNKEVSKFCIHSSWISCLAWTSDESYFASGSNDHQVKLWCQQENYYLRTFTGHEKFVNSLKFSRSERFLISASAEKIIVWKLNNNISRYG